MTSPVSQTNTNTISQQQSAEQLRAKEAWTRVQEVTGQPGWRKEYGQLARNAPAVILSNGLGQTLSFWKAKGYKNGRPKDNGGNPHARLLEHVSAWVLSQLDAQNDGGLLGWVMDAKTTTDDYRRATAEAMSFLTWLKRFAEAELGE